MPETQLVKKPRPARPIIEQPTLVILHEKHGQWHFLVQNDEDLFRVALSVVRGRQKQGYWYEKAGPKPTEPGFTAAEIEKLPKALQADAQKKLQAYERDLRYWQEVNQNHQDITKCLAENDGRLAWRILRDRSDDEYERVSLERLSTEYDV